MERCSLENRGEGTVLFVDDDGEASASLIKALKSIGLRARCDAHTSATAALREICREGHTVHVALIDLSLEPLRGVESGFALLTEAQRASPETRFIVLTGHGSDEFGIRALQMGAASFLEKPASPSHLLALIQDGIAQSQLRRAVKELASVSAPEGVLFGTGTCALKLQRELEFLSSNSLSVFLRGETGVGKSFFAWCIHRRAASLGRTTGQFVSYAPRAGGADLIGSDLFGHAKGAFTGATEAKRGLLAHVNGGTLFLDEVDELPVEVQVTLLTVLQTKRFRPLGTAQEEEFTGRVISASNADHEESQRSGKLRGDLFHRLAQEIVVIPPLRERSEDITALAVSFLADLNRTEPSALAGLSADALLALSAYKWPGNVRELEKAVQRAAAHAVFERQVMIRLCDLPNSISAAAGVPGASSGTSGSTAVQNSAQATSFAEQVENYKTKLIKDALAKHNGNQLKAAESLQLDRSSLRRILSRS